MQKLLCIFFGCAHVFLQAAGSVQNDTVQTNTPIQTTVDVQSGPEDSLFTSSDRNSQTAAASSGVVTSSSDAPTPADSSMPPDQAVQATSADTSSQKDSSTQSAPVSDSPVQKTSQDQKDVSASHSSDEKKSGPTAPVMTPGMITITIESTADQNVKIIACDAQMAVLAQTISSSPDKDKYPDYPVQHNTKKDKITYTLAYDPAKVVYVRFDAGHAFSKLKVALTDQIGALNKSVTMQVYNNKSGDIDIKFLDGSKEVGKQQTLKKFSLHKKTFFNDNEIDYTITQQSAAGAVLLADEKGTVQDQISVPAKSVKGVDLYYYADNGAPVIDGWFIHGLPAGEKCYISYKDDNLGKYDTVAPKVDTTGKVTIELSNPGEKKTITPKVVDDDAANSELLEDPNATDASGVKKYPDEAAEAVDILKQGQLALTQACVALSHAQDTAQSMEEVGDAYKKSADLFMKAYTLFRGLNEKATGTWVRFRLYTAELFALQAFAQAAAIYFKAGKEKKVVDVYDAMYRMYNHVNTHDLGDAARELKQGYSLLFDKKWKDAAGHFEKAGDYYRAAGDNKNAEAGAMIGVYVVVAVVIAVIAAFAAIAITGAATGAAAGAAAGGAAGGTAGTSAVTTIAAVGGAISGAATGFTGGTAAVSTEAAIAASLASVGGEVVTSSMAAGGVGAAVEGAIAGSAVAAAAAAEAIAAGGISAATVTVAVGDVIGTAVGAVGGAVGGAASAAASATGISAAAASVSAGLASAGSALASTTVGGAIASAYAASLGASSAIATATMGVVAATATGASAAVGGGIGGAIAGGLAGALAVGTVGVIGAVGAALAGIITALPAVLFAVAAASIVGVEVAVVLSPALIAGGFLLYNNMGPDQIASYMNNRYARAGQYYFRAAHCYETAALCYHKAGDIQTTQLRYEKAAYLAQVAGDNCVNATGSPKPTDHANGRDCYVYSAKLWRSAQHWAWKDKNKVAELTDADNAKNLDAAAAAQAKLAATDASWGLGKYNDMKQHVLKSMYEYFMGDTDTAIHELQEGLNDGHHAQDAFTQAKKIAPALVTKTTDTIKTTDHDGVLKTTGKLVTKTTESGQKSWAEKYITLSGKYINSINGCIKGLQALQDSKIDDKSLVDVSTFMLRCSTDLGTGANAVIYNNVYLSVVQKVIPVVQTFAQSKMTPQKDATKTSDTKSKDTKSKDTKDGSVKVQAMSDADYGMEHFKGVEKEQAAAFDAFVKKDYLGTITHCTALVNEIKKANTGFSKNVKISGKGGKDWSEKYLHKLKNSKRFADSCKTAATGLKAQKNDVPTMKACLTFLDVLIHGKKYAGIVVLCQAIQDMIPSMIQAGQAPQQQTNIDKMDAQDVRIVQTDTSKI